MKRPKEPRRLEGGAGWRLVRSCPACGAPEDACRCGARPASRPATGAAVVRLRLEKRVGKAVTVLASEGLQPDALGAILKELKSLCAAGGTLRGREAELQGDHRERARAFLRERGVTVKG